MTQYLSSLIPYAPKSAQQESVFFIPHLCSISAVTNAAATVQRHELHSAFSIKSSTVEQGNVMLMEK